MTNMTDLENAKELLASSGASCVLCRGGRTYTSARPGIAPMLDFLSENADMRGFSAADKIVGKAAAMLFVCAGVCAVHGAVMSRAGLAFLEKYGVAASYDELVDVIINRKGTGSCPMELTVADIDDPAEAEDALRRKLASLSQSITE